MALLFPGAPALQAVRLLTAHQEPRGREWLAQRPAQHQA